MCEDTHHLRNLDRESFQPHLGRAKAFEDGEGCFDRGWEVLLEGFLSEKAGTSGGIVSVGGHAK